MALFHQALEVGVKLHGELLPPLGVASDEARHAVPPAAEEAEAVLVDGDGLGLQAEDVGPDLAGVAVADLHAEAGVRFLGLGPAHDEGEAVGPLVVAAPDPADAVAPLKVVLLLAVRVELPRQQEVGQALDGGLGVGEADAVEVAEEDARVAFPPEEEETVGEGHELLADGRVHGLAFLSVVVPDKSLQSRWSVSFLRLRRGAERERERHKQ